MSAPENNDSDCVHTQKTLLRNNFTRIITGNKERCEHYCNICKRWKAPTFFAPSSIRIGTRACSKCSYQRYRAKRMAKLSVTECTLVLIARQLETRERVRGVRPSVKLSRDEVRRLVCDRYKQRSLLSGKHLPLKEASLVRVDESLPFDVDQNCGLVSQRELRSRARLMTTADRVPEHKEALKIMNEKLARAASAILNPAIP